MRELTVPGPDAVSNAAQGEETLCLLPGYRQTGPTHAVAYCPFHERQGSEPSLQIDVVRKDGIGPLGVYISCPVCPGKVNGVRVADHYGIPQRKLLYGSFPSFGKVRRPPASLPSPGVVSERCDGLVGQPLHDLSAWRGIAPETFKAYEVGYADGYYLLPVRASEGGPVVNVRRCKLGGKLNGLRRRGTQLYPWPPKDERWVLLTEGEWDCLAARQRGLPAYTSTGGAGTWEAAWNPYFRGVKVVVIYDCDNGGRNGARAVARSLAPYVRGVKVVDLCPRRNDKYDLSEFFKKYDKTELMKRMRAGNAGERGRVARRDAR